MLVNYSLKKTLLFTTRKQENVFNTSAAGICCGGVERGVSTYSLLMLDNNLANTEV